MELGAVGIDRARQRDVGVITGVLHPPESTHLISACSIICDVS